MKEILEKIPMNRKLATDIGIAPIPGELKFKKNKIIAIFYQFIASISPKMLLDFEGKVDPVTTLLADNLGQE